MIKKKSEYDKSVNEDVTSSNKEEDDDIASRSALRMDTAIKRKRYDRLKGYVCVFQNSWMHLETDRTARLKVKTAFV